MKKLFIIRKLHRSVNDAWLKLGILIGGCFFSLLALADDPSIGSNNLGTMAIKMQTETTFVKSFLLTLAQAVGIGMFIYGLFLWKKVSKSEAGGNKTHTTAIFICVIGAAMYFIPLTMGAAAGSLLTP